MRPAFKTSDVVSRTLIIFLGAVMVPGKFFMWGLCAIAILSAACTQGTSLPLAPLAPSNTTTNPDGTLLKASAPQVSSPQGSTRIANLTPKLSVQNATVTYDSTATLTYEFQVLDGSTTVVSTTEPIAAGSGQTDWTVPAKALKANTTYAWRARAIYNGIAGSWSESAEFLTPVPKPTNEPGPIFCAGSTGKEIVACVAAAFPERLVKTSTGDFSDERRFANMEFVRDTIIATGRCKGLNLGRNFKRGGPEISRDFIVWRRSGKPDNGVDIARGYDATGSPLQLGWLEFPKDRSYGHPFWGGFPFEVDCSLAQAPF
jgi:hypothetical protein